MENERKCRIENNKVICDDEPIEKSDEKQPTQKREGKEKCEILIDPSTNQKLQVCSKGGKTHSARLMAGEFSQKEE